MSATDLSADRRLLSVTARYRGDSVDFGGKYTGATRVGHGAAGTVYRARSVTFDRLVAIKVFHGTLDDERLQRNFQRECQVLGRLGGHPHIVAVHDSGITDDDRPYLVMAYYDLGSLPTDQALDPTEAGGVAVAVAEALQAAHDQGVLHRDVKPQNVLRSSTGAVALADFGISVRGPAELTSAAATASYAAPEVLQDHQAAAPASDVYGLAATLYNLLAGRPPHPPKPGESDLRYLQRMVAEPHRPLPATVPPELAAVVHAGLSKDPASRPASARAFADALRAALGQPAAAPTAPTAPTPSTAPARRSPQPPIVSSPVVTTPVGVPAAAAAAPAAAAPGQAPGPGSSRTDDEAHPDATAFASVTRTSNGPRLVDADAGPARSGPRRKLLAVAGAAVTTVLVVAAILLLAGRSGGGSRTALDTPSTGGGQVQGATSAAPLTAPATTTTTTPAPTTPAPTSTPTATRTTSSAPKTTPAAKASTTPPAPKTSTSAPAKVYDGNGVLLVAPRITVGADGIAVLTATIEVNRPVTFEHLQIAVRDSEGNASDPNGEAFDVAFTNNVTVTVSRTISGSRHYIGGPFKASVAYRLSGGSWINGPRASFTAPS
jgi:serine/threonine protein kinase